MLKEIVELGNSLHLEDNNIEKILALFSESTEPKNFPIIFDFYLKEKEVDIRKGNEFKKDDKNKYFIISKKGNFPHIFLNTVRISVWCTSRVIDDTIKNLNNSKHYQNLRDLMESIKNFYDFKISLKNNESFWIINPNYIKNDELRDNILKFIKEGEHKSKNSFVDNIENKLVKYFNQNSDDYNIKYILIYVNGKPILNDLKIKKEYLSFIYDKLFSDKGNEHEGICHVCGKLKKLRNRIDIPSKFYMQDKSCFFEDVNESNSYKSFSICNECYIDLILGLRYIDQYLSLKLWGSNYYIIPKSSYFIKNPEESYNKLSKMLNFSFGNIQKELDDIKTLAALKESNNLIFDILFFEKNQSAFKIQKHYIDISELKVRQIDNLLYKLNGFNRNVFRFNKYVNINTLKDVFYSDYKIKDKASIYNNLYNFLDCLVYNYPLNKGSFFELLMSNIKRIKYDSQNNNHKNKNDKIFNKISEAYILIQLYKKMNLWGDEVDENDKWHDWIENKALKEFIIESDLDKKRGAFLLFGYLIGKLIYAQLKKHGYKLSSSFLDKVNFDGLKKRNLIELYNSFVEYQNIYKNYYFEDAEESKIKELVGEVISSYDNDINSKEVLFYILLGINLSSVVGKKKKMEVDMNVKKEGNL